MALASLADLDQYAAIPFPHDWPHDRRVFHSPVDKVHEALVVLVGSASESLVIALYGFDDDELADIIHIKMADPHIHVALTLDSSQAGGVHERLILAKEQYPNNTVAIGRSRKGAIMHLKAGVIDGRYVFKGSTNWSASGEGEQENELTIVDNRAEAHRMRTQIDAIHQHMLAAAKPAKEAA